MSSLNSSGLLCPTVQAQGGLEESNYDEKQPEPRGKSHSQVRATSSSAKKIVGSGVTMTIKKTWKMTKDGSFRMLGVHANETAC